MEPKAEKRVGSLIENVKRMPMKARIIITQLIIISLILLWLLAGIPKVMDIATFSKQLERMPYIGGMHGLISWLLPVIMLLAAVLLTIPRTKLYGLYLSLGLLIAFGVYIVSVLTFSDFVPCTCAGIRINIAWKEHLLICGSGILLTSLAIWMERRNNKGASEPYENHSKDELYQL